MAGSCCRCNDKLSADEGLPRPWRETILFISGKRELPPEIINHTGHESGIDAAVIVPSIIDTPSNRKSMPDADFSKWVTPGQLAENIYFLSTTAGRKQRKAVFKIYGDS